MPPSAKVNFKELHITMPICNFDEANSNEIENLARVKRRYFPAADSCSLGITSIIPFISGSFIHGWSPRMDAPLAE